MTSDMIETTNGTNGSQHFNLLGLSLINESSPFTISIEINQNINWSPWMTRNLVLSSSLYFTDDNGNDAASTSKTEITFDLKYQNDCSNHEKLDVL